jgi:putative selenium metabolism protein SsnA
MALALTGGTVVRSLIPPRVERADVLIDGGRIVSVGTTSGPAASRDCSGCLILPGNVCAHTHLYSALARGMPYRLDPPANFVQILQRIWWRLDRALDAETIRASALAGGMEALLSGTTTVFDHHASPNAIEGSLDLIADALEELGLRSILCYEVTDRDGTKAAMAGVEENRRFLQAGRGGGPLTRAMVGAHASFTLSPDTLDACVELARSTGEGIHIHVAEDLADQLDARARFGKPVVSRLADAGALDERSLLAHCIYLDQEETALVREAGASVAHNPTSNMNNSVGHAAVAILGDRVALGTDGIGADMFAESHTAYFRAREENVFETIDWPLRRLAHGADLAGRAFGESELGRMEPGAPADLAILDYRPPTTLHQDNLGGHWSFGLAARHVRDVVVNGEMVVQDRRPTRVDQDEVASLCAEQAERLWRAIDRVDPHGFEPAGGD